MTYLLNILFTLIPLLVVTGCDNHLEPDKIYRISGSIAVDGISRTYLLNLPPEYYDEGREKLPLVIGLHGTGGSAAQFERDYGFTTKANRSGFIVVYPEGVRSDGPLGIRTWNAGTCCDYAMEHNIDDVEFIKMLIATLTDQYRINPKKVYVTGMSNGGMLTYRLANELPDKIAAIAPVSSTMLVAQSGNTNNPLPILHIHSALDTKIPFRGGDGIGGYYFPPVDSVLQTWSKKHACLEPTVIVNDSRYKLTEWKGCDKATVIQCYLTQDGGHSWPGGKKSNARGDDPSSALNATDLIWNFFMQYSLP